MMLTEKMIINEDGVIINDLGNTIDIKDFINKILEKDNWIVFFDKDNRFKCVIDNKYYDIEIAANIVENYKNNIKNNKEIELLFNLAECFSFFSNRNIIEIGSAIVALICFSIAYSNLYNMGILAAFMFGVSLAIINPKELEEKIKEYCRAYDRLNTLKDKMTYMEEYHDSNRENHSLNR